MKNKKRSYVRFYVIPGKLLQIAVGIVVWILYKSFEQIGSFERFGSKNGSRNSSVILLRLNVIDPKTPS